MTVTAIQAALLRHGFNPGEVDGVWGRRTMLAVRDFQRAHGLEIDGIVGPLTLRALTGPAAGAAGPSEEESGPLVWYEMALSLVGIREDKSVRSNPEILEWADKLDIDYKRDDIPWCGLFVAHCVGSTLPDEILPRNPLGARQWAKFGEPCRPMRGAILIFWREKREGFKGHVGFYHGEDDSSFHVLGGNQNDSVNLARIGKNRFLAARWPRTANFLVGAVVHTETDADFSHKES